MRILTLLLTSLLVLTTAPARATVTTDPYVGTSRTAPRPADFAIGDSTMARAWDKYRLAGYRGELNGVSGRSVEDLPALVAERCANVHKVRRAIVGLGTNGGYQTFTRSGYVRAVDALKRCGARKVVLIAPYRTDRWWDHWRVAERRYWMLSIARHRRGVCVVDNGGFAAAHPQVMEPDGLHWTDHFEPLFVASVMVALNGRCR